MEIVIIVGIVAVVAWLTLGFMAYGAIFAYLQRHFSPEEASKDLYKDMREGLRFIPQGFFGAVKVVDYLTVRDAWNFDEAGPLYGVKFLPRHEHRL